MEKKKDLNFSLKNKDANLYMAEHLRSTTYFPLPSYRTLVNPKIARPLHP
jgi:hypothetical protein